MGTRLTATRKKKDAIAAWKTEESEVEAVLPGEVSAASEPAGEDGYTADSRISTAYLGDIAPTVHLARMEYANVGFGEDYPAVLSFGNDEWGVEGVFMIAPRIEDE
jgi:hypothetical protein